MAAAGAIAGLELLNQESVGIELALLTVITSLAARGPRREQVPASLGALLVAFLAAWALTGQHWGALFAYVHNAVRIVSGYAAAMSLQNPAVSWEYPVGWVAFAFGVAAALHMTADGGSRRRWGIVALWVAFCFVYKKAFVRHDPGHGAGYFVALMGAFFAFRWRHQSRPIGVALAAALFSFAIAAQNPSISTVFDPGGNSDMAVKQLAQVFDPSERAAIVANGREVIQQSYNVDPATLSLVQGHTVHVFPYDTSVVWAYHLNWRPLPVFQSYLAYTTGLDQLDANALDSAQAPQRILRSPDPGIDGRVQAFDEGLTTRTILCRYMELRATNTWQVLALGANRCQPPSPLSVVRAGWYQPVPVPAPPSDHTFVSVRIEGAGVGGLERLTALLYKPAERVVLLDVSVIDLSRAPHRTAC